MNFLVKTLLSGVFRAGCKGISWELRRQICRNLDQECLQGAAVLQLKSNQVVEHQLAETN